MIERKVFTEFSCPLCGASEIVDGAVGVTTFEGLHKQCEILYQALLKYIHIGPCAPIGFLPVVSDLAKQAKNEYQKDSTAKEIDYDKFYR